MEGDARVERLIDDVAEAEESSGPVRDWVRQQALLTLLVVGFIIGSYVEWQLLHPAFLILYAVVGIVVVIRYLTRRRAARKVDELLLQAGEQGGLGDDVS